MKYPNRLYELRTEKGLKQSEVAEVIGIAQPEYSKMERGDRTLGIHTQNIAKFFEVEIAFLKFSLTFKENKEELPINPVLIELPLYGMPLANGEEGFQFQKQMISRCERPDYMKNNNEGYGCFMLSNNMDPKYNHGDLLYVDPKLKVYEGDFVIVKLLKMNKDIGLIRQVYDSYGLEYKFNTLAPRKIEKFDKDSILGVHKIVGTRTNII